MLALPAGEDLDRGAAHVDDQHVPRPRAPGGSAQAPGSLRALRFHDGGQLARLSTADLEPITSIRSFQDLTNDLAPSSCSCLASAPTSIVASANRFSSCSASPPSVGMVAPTLPWSASALSVASGIVLTVNGAASAST